MLITKACILSKCHALPQYTCKCIFIYTCRKSAASPALLFMKCYAQQYYMQVSYSRFYLKWDNECGEY